MLTKSVGHTGKSVHTIIIWYSMSIFFLISGGYKRKLSCAIAMIGKPPIILLVSTCMTINLPFQHSSRLQM